MFQNMSPHLNTLVQAAVATHFQGGEQQKRVREDKEKSASMFFLLLKSENGKNLTRTNHASGRMA